MAVTKRLRYEILRRDNHTCRYCGATAPDAPLTIDHVIPTALGGTDEPDNLVAACADCNSGKTSSNPDAPLVDDVTEDDIRWGEAIKRAAAVQREQAQVLAYYIEDLDTIWIETFAGLMDTRHEPHRGWHKKSDPDREYEYAIHHWTADGELIAQGIHLCDSLSGGEQWIEHERRRLTPPRPDTWAGSAHAWMAADIDGNDFAEAARIVKNAGHVPWDNRWRYLCGVIWRRIEQRHEIARGLIEANQGDA